MVDLSTSRSRYFLEALIRLSESMADKNPRLAVEHRKGPHDAGLSGFRGWDEAGEILGERFADHLFALLPECFGVSRIEGVASDTFGHEA